MMITSLWKIKTFFLEKDTVMQHDCIKHVQINRIVFRKLNVKNKLDSLMPDLEYVCNNV